MSGSRTTGASEVLESFSIVTRPRPQALPLLALAAAAVLAVGGTGFFGLGFYHDDWTALSFLHFAGPGLWARMSALVQGVPSLWFRPFDVPLVAGLYCMFGENPVPWQAALLATNVLVAHAVYRLLRRYDVPTRASLLGAALFLVYPSKDATMFWTALIINSFALLCFLNATLFQLDYVESGRRRSLALAAAALALSVATYDQCFFLPCLWLITPSLARRGGVPRRAWIAAAAAAGVLAAFAFYKFWLASRLFGVPYNKTIRFSAGHVLSTYADGAAIFAGGDGLARYVLEAARSALSATPWTAGAALALPWLLLGVKDEPGPAPRETPLILLGLGVFALGYLPIAVSDYNPTAFNHMNRINQVPTLGLVLAAVGAVQRWRRSAWLIPAGCGLASLLLAAHVSFAASWREAYREENRVKELVLAHAAGWPAGATLVLALPEPFVREKAPIFLEHWDLGGAVRVWTEDPTREAGVINDRTDFRPEGIVLRPGRAPLPYGSVIFAEVSHDVFTKVQFGNFHRGRAR